MVYTGLQLASLTYTYTCLGHICTVHPQLSESCLSEPKLLQVATVHVQLRRVAVTNFVGVLAMLWYGLFSVEQKRNDTALFIMSVRKLLFDLYNGNT